MGKLVSIFTEFEKYDDKFFSVYYIIETKYQIGRDRKETSSVIISSNIIATNIFVVSIPLV
jgi:hypothetical protein